MIEPRSDFTAGAGTTDLVRSELRYRRLFESARDGVLILNPVTRQIIDSNPYMCELLGYSRDEILGRELFELGFPEDEPASRAAFARLQTKGFIRYENLPLKTKSGERREVEFVSNLYPEGKSEVIQSNIRDTSARKRLERANEEKARLLDLTNDAIIVRNLEDRIRLWNWGAEKLFGWRQEEVLGQHLHTLLRTKFIEPLEEVTERLHREHQFTGEVIHTCREGRRIPCLCRWVLDSPSASILASYTDITELKAAEAEMAESRDQAIAAGQAKDEFFAALSHELRTPLTPVLLLASDAAQDPDMPESARELFATIARNVTLEARLIDDLLDLNRMTRAKMVIARQPVDVHLALKDAIATVQWDLDAKHLALELSLLPGQPMVIGDAVRLQQIFWNVLRNAQKFTPAGRRIRVSTQLLAGRRLVITVTDPGMGMTQGELGRIFTSFTQGDHARHGGSSLFGGLGLGLSISRQLAEMHSGSIRASSPGLNQGSTFVIELPLAPETADTDTSVLDERSTSPSPPMAATEPQPTRILLVDDHEGTRDVLTRLLSQRHFAVTGAASMAEAQQAASAAPFDVLISDIGLPDGSGYELMAELHARYGLRGVALSGFGEAEDIARSRAAGFTAHVTKPATIAALEQAVGLATAAPARATVPAWP